MAEPSTFSALSSPPGRLQSSRVSTALPHPRRAGRGETFDFGPRRPPQPRQDEPPAEREPAPARREVEVDDPSARLRAAEHASAERTLRGALLVSLLLNLVVFLGVGFSLPPGPLDTLTRADALLAAVTLVAAVGLLALGEICRKGGPPSR